MSSTCRWYVFQLRQIFFTQSGGIVRWGWVRKDILSSSFYWQRLQCPNEDCAFISWCVSQKAWGWKLNAAVFSLFLSRSFALTWVMFLLVDLIGARQLLNLTEVIFSVIFLWFFVFSFFYAYWQDILFYVILLSSFHKGYGFTSGPLEINQLHRKPMNRSMQVYHVPEMAFSSTDLF